MARHIASRLLIEGTLETQTPLHVGGFGNSPDTDMPLASNGCDEHYIPGTSFAGVLRAWCEQAFDEQLIKYLWGYQEKDKGGASFIIVSDMKLPSSAIVEVRDGVGIDRAWGVAADRAKYDRAVIPRGAKMKLRLTVEIAQSGAKDNQSTDAKAADGQSNANRTRAVIGHLLQALKDESLTVGAARTRGLGRIKLLGDVQITEQKLDAFDSILDAIEGKPAPDTPNTIEGLTKADEQTKPKPRRQIAINIKWHPRSPLMVKAGYDGIGVDMLPLVSATGNKELSLVLPGSSIKGALRSHAERIVRTLLNFTPHQRKTDFHDQIEVELINFLFGSRGKSAAEKRNQPNGNATSKNITPGRGALSIADCYAQQKLNADKWRALEIAGSKDDTTYSATELWKAIKTATGDTNPTADTKNFHIEHHVAIDRWTGGAADGALYSVLAPAADTGWDCLKLSLDFSRLPDASRRPAFVLLLLVLRDLVENRIPLGFATTRGMGEVEIENITIASEELKRIGIAEDFGFEIENPNGNARLKFTGDIGNLNTAWTEWINELIPDQPQAVNEDDEQAA